MAIGGKKAQQQLEGSGTIDVRYSTASLKPGGGSGAAFQIEATVPRARTYTLQATTAEEAGRCNKPFMLFLVRVWR